NAGRLCARNQRFAYCIESFGLLSRQRAEWNILCMRLAWREQDLSTTDAERKRTQCRALHEGAPFHLGHYFLPTYLSLSFLRLYVRPRRLSNEAKSKLKLNRESRKLL